MTSSPPATGKAERLLWHLALGMALLSIAAFLLVAVLRIGYPFELEWMEGGMADHVARILDGHSLYVAPSLEFVPYGYTPLYFYVAAGIAKVIGMGFFPLRLLSFLSSLGAMALIAGLVFRHGGDRVSATLAAGLYAACFGLCGFWYDTARLDPFFLLLLLAAAALAAGARNRHAWVGAGLLLGAAYLTKQTALPIALAMVGYTVLWNRRAFLPLTLPLAGVAGGGYLLLNTLSHGWFAYYTTTLPRLRWLTKQLPKRWLEYWTGDLLTPLAVALLLTALYFFWRRPRDKAKDHRKAFFFVLLGAMVTTVWISRVEYGAYGNVLLPAYAAVAIGAGLGTARCRGMAREHASRMVRLGLLGVPLLLLVQFAILAYHPLRQIPSHADRMAGKKLVSLVARMPGAVWLPHHAYLSRLAGKPPTAHEVAIKNLIRIDPGPVQQKFTAEIEQAIRDRRFAAIISDQSNWYARELAAVYRIRGPVFPVDSVFYPKVGRKMRPEIVWVPQTSPIARGGDRP